MTEPRLNELLDFENLHVAIVGDVMLDSYITGRTERISPEAPVPILNLEQREDRLGGAANVALNISSLGAKASLIGLIGDDKDGTTIKGLCGTHQKISQHLISDETRVTTRKTRIISQSQHLLRIDEEETHPVGTKTVDQVVSILEQIHNDHKIDIVILQDYNKGFFSPDMITNVIAWCSEKGLKTCLDPKKENLLLYKGVTVFKPNLKELSWLLDRPIKVNTQDLNTSAQLVLDTLDCKQVILTLGSKGVFIKVKDAYHYDKITAKSITDVSGAGDSVLALTSLLSCKNEASIQEMCFLANCAGGAICNISGVGVLSKKMLLSYMQVL